MVLGRDDDGLSIAHTMRLSVSMEDEFLFKSSELEEEFMTSGVILALIVSRSLT
jgi:hypothetical protein